MKNGKEKTSQATWLDAALDLLAEEGIDNLTINKLSKKVGLAKTSFYWHFKNRDELIAMMLDYWIDQFTEILGSDTKFSEAPPREALLAMLKAIRSTERGKYELAFRAWAKNDKLVAEKVQFAHNKRMTLIKNLLGKLGFKGEELNARARVIVTYFSYQKIMMYDGADGSFDTDKLCLELMLSPTTTQ